MIPIESRLCRNVRDGDEHPEIPPGNGRLRSWADAVKLTRNALCCVYVAYAFDQPRGRRLE
jgi:hypothetical protein